LVNELTSVHAVGNGNLNPQLRVATFDEVTSLLLEHRGVVVANGDQLIVAEAFGVRTVLLQERSVENDGILATSLDTSLEPGENQLEPISSFDFMDQLADNEVSGHRCEQRLGCGLVAVNIQETTDDLRSADVVDPLHVHLNEAGKTVLVRVENKVAVQKVETMRGS